MALLQICCYITNQCLGTKSVSNLYGYAWFNNTLTKFQNCHVRNYLAIDERRRRIDVVFCNWTSVDYVKLFYGFYYVMCSVMFRKKKKNGCFNLVGEVRWTVVLLWLNGGGAVVMLAPTLKKINWVFFLVLPVKTASEILQFRKDGRWNKCYEGR